MTDFNSQKTFIGPKLRRLRTEKKLSQASFAKALGLSPSYLNQLERDQRPVTARVLMQLSSVYDIDVATLTRDDADRMGADIRETLADPLLGGQKIGLAAAKQMYRSAPELAAALLASSRINQQYQQKLHVVDSTFEANGTSPTSASTVLLPYEEVRDFFHYRNNYIPELDTEAEKLDTEMQLAGPAPLGDLCTYLREKFETMVDIDRPSSDVETMLRIDPKKKRIFLNGYLPIATQCFQLAAQIGTLRHRKVIEEVVDGANFQTKQAQQICSIALSNYFAGALLMPYGKLFDEAKRVRHDIERLQRMFGTSFEQVCHRLSNLQQPGRRGIPFFFVRVDQAGNITKRHSATRLQFARFGGACPLWNVHESFSQPGRIFVQIAETPDKIKYLSVARSIIKRAGQFDGFNRNYAVALGCEIEHSEDIIYGDGIDLTAEQIVTPIGVSCRICERQNCRQRAFPPIDREMATDPDIRNYIPYQFE